MIKNVLASLVLILFIVESQAQMLKPIDMIPINKETIVYPLSGDPVKGTIKTAMYMNGKLMSFTLRPDNGGDAIRYKAADVKSVKMKPSKLEKFSAGLSDAGSIDQLKSVDWNALLDMEWVYFETIVLKDGGRSWLMQRLNPGEQYNKMKIFVDPTIMGESTGDPSAYFITKGDGQTAFFVKKKEYLKKGSEIFSDCPDMIHMMEKTSYNFDNIGAHVSFYNVLCK